MKLTGRLIFALQKLRKNKADLGYYAIEYTKLEGNRDRFQQFVYMIASCPSLAVNRQCSFKDPTACTVTEPLQYLGRKNLRQIKHSCIFPLSTG